MSRQRSIRCLEIILWNLLVCGVGFAQDTSDASILASKQSTAVQSNNARDYWNEKQQRVMTLLDKQIAIDFFEVPISDVITQLAEEHEFDVTFEQEEFDNLGVDTASPVTVIQRDISLRGALKLILKPFDLNYYIEDGLVVVTSVEMAEEHLVHRHFVIRDLLHKETPAASAKQIMSMLTTIVSPDSWEQVGGQGTLMEYQGILVVRQTNEALDQVATLLTELRQNLQVAGGPVLNHEDTAASGSKP
jgi:hypothetical protein